MSERLSEFSPRTVLEHTELASSFKTDGEGNAVPHQLQVFLEATKRQYLDFMKRMQVSTPLDSPRSCEGQSLLTRLFFWFQEPVFKARVESDLAEEKKRNSELQKRQKQLQSQIETLIADSTGLLNTKLLELGIQVPIRPELRASVHTVFSARGRLSVHFSPSFRPRTLPSSSRRPRV